MAGFDFEGVFAGLGSGSIQSVTELVEAEIDGNSFLVALSRNEISVLEIDIGGSLLLIDQFEFSHAFAPGYEPSLTAFEIDDQTLLGVSGQMPGGTQFVELDIDGTLSEFVTPTGWPTFTSHTSKIQLEGGSYTITASGGPEFGLFRWETPELVESVGSFSLPSGGSVTGMEASTVNNSLRIIAEGGDTIRTLSVSDAGVFATIDRIGASDGLGIAGVNSIEAIKAYGGDFAILGGNESSTLSVLRVTGSGDLVFSDHIIDGLPTRFQNVDAIDALTIGDRAYVVAGGADDGISAFQLLPDGRLHHLASVEDSTAASLQNVSGLHAMELDGILRIVASSEAEEGLSVFELETANVGVTEMAGVAGGMMQGSSSSDILNGSTGNDLLVGLDGDDILVDGFGSDTLFGGSGSDTFVFDADGVSDSIGDFESGLDTIELSRIPMIYDVNSLDIVPTANGAQISVQDEIIIVESVDGASISPSELKAGISFGVDRPPFLTTTQTLIGTPGDDSLEGGLGDDAIFGNGGNDVLLGDEGADTIDAGAGSDQLHGGIGADSLWGGDGADTAYGEDGNDTLAGAADDDWIDGGNGHDLIAGGMSGQFSDHWLLRRLEQGDEYATTLEEYAGLEGMF